MRVQSHYTSRVHASSGRRGMDLPGRRRKIFPGTGPSGGMRRDVVVLVGAGLSTASGIPDYRSAEGLWTLFDPEEFHIERFLADPDGFWRRRVDLIQRSGILDAEPNEGHRILACAARDGPVAAIVTQNVDGLHHKAETPIGRIIEVHGDSARSRCIACGRMEDTRAVVARYGGGAPRCLRPRCGGLLRPNVVLFGEPVTRLGEAWDALRGATTLVTVGTSLQVWPVAGLVQEALSAGIDVVIVNDAPTPFDGRATRVLRTDVVEGLGRLFPDAARGAAVHAS